MLINEVLLAEKITVVTPEVPLEVTDFEALSLEVDPYIKAMDGLNGLMIYAESFAGWENFSALLSHMKFVKEHHHNIKKVAAVTDTGFLSILPQVVGFFVQAEVKHFPYEDKAIALDWLKSTDG